MKGVNTKIWSTTKIMFIFVHTLSEAVFKGLRDTYDKTQKAEMY